MRFCLLILTLSSFLLSSKTFCQDFNAYENLVSSDKIPDEFVQSAGEKFRNQLNALNFQSEVSQNEREEFIYYTTYLVDQFLKSGDVLFNDPISQYLNSVIDTLRSFHPFDENIRVYTVKSSVPNAYTVGGQIIFFNIGLLARLENEAQLAFILSHELVHIQNEHGINTFSLKSEVEKNGRVFKKMSKLDRLFVKNSYSQELELESDEIGFEIYSKTPYNLFASKESFQVMKNADLPLAWQPFSVDRFNTSYYQAQFLDSTESESKIVLEDEELENESEENIIDWNKADSLISLMSSHPNIDKRIQNLEDKLADKKEEGTNFLLPESKFNLIRKYARFELCRVYLMDGHFDRALDLAYSLSAEHGESNYLDEIIVKALYGIYDSKSEKDNAFYSLDNFSSEKAGKFFTKLSDFEMGVLTIKEAWEQLEQKTEDPSIEQILKEVIASMSARYTDLSSRFKHNKMDEISSVYNLTNPQDAFLSFQDTDSFFIYLEKEIELQTGDENDDLLKAILQPELKELPSGPVNSVLVFEPMVRVFDHSKSDIEKQRFDQAERTMENYRNYIKDVAKKLEINTHYLGVELLDEPSAEQINDEHTLKIWLRELISNLEDQSAVSPLYKDILEISEKYNTPYLLWCGSISNKGRSILNEDQSEYGPIENIRMKLLRPKHYSFFYSFLIDLREQKVVLAEAHEVNMKNNRWITEASIYNALKSLK